MADSRLGILIEAKNRTGAQFAEVRREMGALDNAARTASGGLGAMAGAFAGGLAVAQVAGMVKDLILIGAQAERTEAAFRRVAQSYGTNADAMMAAMRGAAAGQISNDDLMLAANKAMLLGVTSNAEQMAGLLQVAMTRGQAMGRSAADAFGDIVTGIGRMSPLILDNLGIMTGGEQAFQTYAAALGKTAEQLTDVERKQMLINKVLADAGPVAQDAQGKITSLGVAWANLYAEQGKTLVANLTMLGVPEYLDAAAQIIAARRRVTDAFLEAGVTEAQMGQGFEKAGGERVFPLIPDAALRQQREAIASLFAAYDEGSISIEQFDTEIANALALLASHQAAAAADAAAMGIMRAGFDGVRQSAAEAAAGMSVVTRQANELAGAALRTIGPLTQAAAALSAWDLVTGALVPNLDAVSAATQSAIERIKSIGIGAVDVLGASGAIDRIHAYEDALQGLRDKAIALGWTDLELATAQQVLFNEFGDQVSGLRRVTGATSTYNAELSALLSTTEQFINASVGSTKGLVDLGDQGLVNGFDPNGPARDFGRMWDVAVNGFNSQWLDELRAQGLIPDDVIAAGEDALRQFAEGKARAFQSGADLGLLDTGQIVEQVKAELAARAELERVKQEVLAQLRGAGIGGAGAAAAVDTVMGIEPAAGTSKAEAGGVAGKSFQDGFVTGMAGLGVQVTAELARQMVAQAVALSVAGHDAGDRFVVGFTERAADLPTWFVDFLGGMLTPLIEARIRANASRSQPPTGAQP